MSILFEAGKLKVGDELEPIPEILPRDIRGRLAPFRAKILKGSGGRDSIQWKGEDQSPSQMLVVLEKEFGAIGKYHVHRNFRLVGHERSLREEADLL
jgi:hypothetical protein